MSTSGATALSPTAKGGNCSSSMGGGSDPEGSLNLTSSLRNLTKGTVPSSIFILLTTCIGAGTLSLPYAFAKGGILVFSIIFFIIMVCQSVFISKAKSLPMPEVM